jgi:hypothetical protein
MIKAAELEHSQKPACEIPNEMSDFFNAFESTVTLSGKLI